MLVKISEILNKAKKEGYGVPAILTCNQLGVEAVIRAAEDENSPVILLCGATQTPDLNYLGRIMNDYANKAKIPVAMILDHSSTKEQAIKGIHAGFNTIMVDRSTLSYEENVKQVKELTEIAHLAHVEVEAELGHVGLGEAYDVDGKSALTVPSEALQFVKETNVDCLAVAIGSAHGVYKGEPKLDFDLLKELNEVVPVPLVLHGGSGTGEKNLNTACHYGIAKVNIANDVLRAAQNALEKAGTEGNKIYGFFDMISEGYYTKSRELMRLFESSNKAS